MRSRLDRLRDAHLFGGFVALALLRAPWLLFAPRFFAEEGVVYFRYATSHSFLETLGAWHLGYFALVPNLGAALAALLPLPYAPYATSLVGFLVQLLPAWLVIEDRELFRSRPRVLFFLSHRTIIIRQTAAERALSARPKFFFENRLPR